MRLKITAAAVLVAVVALVAVVMVYTNHGLPKLREQASALDTAAARDTAQLARDTLATDAALKSLADSFKTGAPIKAAVKAERHSATQALRTTQAQVKNRDRQIRALTPRLRLFVSSNYEMDPGGPLLEGNLTLRGGAALRLGAGLSAESYVEQPLLGDDNQRRTLNLALRKDWRIY